MGGPVLGHWRGRMELSFCRNKAVKLLKRLDWMSGSGENGADPGMEGSKDAVRGFLERERPERRGYGQKKGENGQTKPLHDLESTT